MKLKKIFKNIIRSFRDKQGVTMVEVLVVLALIGVVLLPASQALVNGMNNYATETENMERVYNAQNTLDYITDRVRFNANQKIKIVDVTNINNFPTSEGVGNALVIEDAVIYYNGKNEIKEYKLNKDGNYTLSTLLKHSNGLVFEHIEEVATEKEETVGTKNFKLSRFDVAIKLEKKDSGEETFRTTVYLRNK